MYELSVKSHFAASHYLRGYKGKCQNLHGHTWKVEVVLCKPRLNKMGMVLDFTFVKQHLKEILDELDHTHLNDLASFRRQNPTTEHLARYIYNALVRKCRPLKVKEVTVWESDAASVTYRR